MAKPANTREKLANIWVKLESIVVTRGYIAANPVNHRTRVKVANIWVMLENI